MINDTILPKSLEMIGFIISKAFIQLWDTYFRKHVWALPAGPGQCVLLPLCFCWHFVSGLFILKLGPKVTIKLLGSFQASHSSCWGTVCRRPALDGDG